jgi:hypothetical protein
MNGPADLIDDNETELERLVLKESIVSATGITADSLQIGLKGDPSLRETIIERKKYRSSVDEVFAELEPNLEELLLRRGIYRIFIGFNSGEIRTHSIFDPLREEVHAGERLARQDYIDRHFPRIDYADKIAWIRELYRALRASPLFEKLPSYWRNIMTRRGQTWQPMGEDKIRQILSTLSVLRELPEVYLRNAGLCIVQDTVRLQFNCDGTHIISAEAYQKFLQDNLP